MRFELKEIVMRLVGPVQPVGESGADFTRFSNLENLTELVDELVGEINKAGASANRHEASMKAIGRRANEFLLDLKAALDETTAPAPGQEGGEE